MHKAPREPDLTRLYRMMLTSRRLEEEISKLWQEGRISGEMHLGIGEEGIVAGVIDHLGEGDAIAADHRSTPPMVMHGVDPTAIVPASLALDTPQSVYASSMTIQIPNNSLLQGAVFFAQWWAIISDVGTSAILAVATSDGAVIAIGGPNP